MRIKVSHITRRCVPNFVFRDGVQRLTKTTKAYGAAAGKKRKHDESSVGNKLRKLDSATKTEDPKLVEDNKARRGCEVDRNNCLDIFYIVRLEHVEVDSSSAECLTTMSASSEAKKGKYDVGPRTQVQSYDTGSTVNLSESLTVMLGGAAGQAASICSNHLRNIEPEELESIQQPISAACVTEQKSIIRFSFTFLVNAA